MQLSLTPEATRYEALPWQEGGVTRMPGYPNMDIKLRGKSCCHKEWADWSLTKEVLALANHQQPDEQVAHAWLARASRMTAYDA